MRQQRLRQIMKKHQLTILAITPGSTLTYLTGLQLHLLERPILMLFPSQGTPSIILPTLEKNQTQNLPYPVETFFFNDDPSTWGNCFQRATQAIKVDEQIVGIESTKLRFLELSYLQAAAPLAKLIPADTIIETLRLHKDESEIMAMRKSVEIAQAALQATLPIITPGISERQIAAELMAQLLKAGSEATLPFAPIVAAGENSANPHATPSERTLKSGELLLIDWGARYEGYVSDLTRTFAIGEVDAELKNIAKIVLKANAAGQGIAAPGVPASKVDDATRSVINVSGYGKYFIHRTGHGIGLDAHEAPYIYSENHATLATGMAFTIEPGIYLPGRGGVRIEDDIVITDSGAEALTSLPRELYII